MSRPLAQTTATVAALYKYPVKGLSPEPVEQVEVTVEGGLPDDRRFALALGTTRFDPANPEPLEKGFFLMLRRNEGMAALRTRWDPAAGTLSIAAPDGAGLVAQTGTAAGRAEVEDFFLDRFGAACRGRPRFVEAAGHKFTDSSPRSPAMMKAVSIINLASVRDLGQQLGRKLDPLRFRGNIYLEGLPAWAELDWPGRRVAIGSAQFTCSMVTQRCAAIDVDPTTGARDANLVKALVDLYGHPNCGVFLEIGADGGVPRGAPVCLES